MNKYIILILVSLSLFLQPLYSDCVETRKTSAKEQAFSKEIVEKFRQLIPASFEGWEIKKQQSSDSPKWICSATGYEPVTGHYTTHFRRNKEEAKIRYKAFRNAYKKGAKLTTGEEKEFASLKKERSELIKKTRGKRSKRKPDMKRMMAIAKEMEKAMKAKDKEKVEKLQKEYLAASKGGSSGDPDLDRKVKVEEQLSELKSRKNIRGFDNAREFAGDKDFKISIQMNHQYKSIKGVKKIDVKGSKVSFISKKTPALYDANENVSVYIFFGNWNIEESKDRYTLKIDTGKSKKVRRVRTILLSITGSESRIDELLKTLPLDKIASLIE